MLYRRMKMSEQMTGPKRRSTAVALEYTPDKDHAPKVVASGQGVMAEKILALAREHGIPVYNDAPLTAALASINLGEEIPPELYMVVAEVLAYIYRIARQRKY